MMMIDVETTAFASLAGRAYHVAGEMVEMVILLHQETKKEAAPARREVYLSTFALE